VHPAKEVKIIRSRNPELLSKCDIIVDVGNGMSELNGKLVIDHHGRNDTYPNGIRKSSCAMLLDWMFEGTCKSLTNWYQFLLNEWVYGVSAADCGQNAASYRVTPNRHNFVSLMNPTFIESDSEEHYNEMFNKAVDICCIILERYYQAYNSSRNIISYFENEIVNYQGNGVVCLPLIDTKRIVLYNKVVEENKRIVAAVTYDLKYGKYAVHCIPKNCSTDICHVVHPLEWRGLKNDKLDEITGQQGTFLCHNNGKYSLHYNFTTAFNIATKLKQIYDQMEK
jgi:uncharacterized UPF0160 family protein